VLVSGRLLDEFAESHPEASRRSPGGEIFVAFEAIGDVTTRPSVAASGFSGWKVF